MPKGFNEKEKQEIKQALVEKGKILFSMYGLKKTSVEDITKAVGIAQGSFYSFYGSKEELYFTIIESEENLLREQLVTEMDKRPENPKEAIKMLLLRSFELIEKSPIIKRLYAENEMETLIRKLPENVIRAHLNKDSSAIASVLQKWQDAGLLQDWNPEVLMGVFRALFFMTLHKNEIGESVFDEALLFLIDATAKKLVEKNDMRKRGPYETHY
ncbi:HTH-type transcriptional repressor KstR2 [Peptococcaceae bacterium CEB3]|nr:HTH-type transcriptional repressor KstR2 [Peptococcaceae bacterium CEB3]